jgi:proteic killer suppression protein
MIKSFKCKHTENLFFDSKVLRFHAIAKIARMRLISLDIATSLNDLRSPPGNQLELLKGDRKNQYSIRINKQWRICFSFEEGNVYEVEIIDYH